MKTLGESFAMKDLRVGKKILGVYISRDRREKNIWLSREHYIKKVLQIFQIENAKVVSIPLSTHFKLNVR